MSQLRSKESLIATDKAQNSTMVYAIYEEDDHAHHHVLFLNLTKLAYLFSA